MYNFNFQSRQQSHTKAQQQIKQNKLIAKSIILIRNKQIRNKQIQRANIQSYNKARALQAVIEEPSVVEEEPCLVEETQLVLKEEEPCLVEETQLVLKEEEPSVVEEEPCLVEETCIIEELKPVVSVHKDLVYFFRAMKFE